MLLGNAPEGMAAAATQDTPTPVPEVGRSGPPDWTFIVVRMQDPYEGEIVQTDEPERGMRFVAADVAIDNESDQSLAFSVGDVRLRDSTGLEARAGSVVGSAPALNNRNLNPGERARGWVWFAVPVDARLAEVVLVAPSPRLRVLLGPVQ